MKNIPEVKLGIVAVSRDCFPMSLSESRRIKVCQEYKKAYGDIYECLQLWRTRMICSKPLTR